LNVCRNRFADFAYTINAQDCIPSAQVSCAQKLLRCDT
jgi:hypothetical protein